MTAERHPLEAALGRGRLRSFRGCDLGIVTGVPDRPAWRTVRTLVDAPDTLGEVLTRVGAEVESPRTDVQASLFLEAYAWRLVLPILGAWIAEERVVLPTPADVLLRRDAGRPSELWLCPGRFAVAPGDRAAEHEDALVTTGLDAALRRGLVEHFTPIVDALHDASGRSRPALWRTVADRCATACLYASGALGDPDAGRALADRLLDGCEPLPTRPNFARTHGSDGEAGDVHLRHGCCLWWRTGAAGAPCLTCPLSPGRRDGCHRR